VRSALPRRCAGWIGERRTPAAPINEIVGRAYSQLLPEMTSVLLDEQVILRRSLRGWPGQDRVGGATAGMEHGDTAPVVGVDASDPRELARGDIEDIETDLVPAVASLLGDPRAVGRPGAIRGVRNLADPDSVDTRGDRPSPPRQASRGAAG
jgi:hypothetical protein